MPKYAGIFEHEKRKKKEQKEATLFISVEKGCFSFKHVNTLVITRGAEKQAPMILGQGKSNKKPKKMHYFCECGKKGHITKNCWQNIARQPKKA